MTFKPEEKALYRRYPNTEDLEIVTIQERIPGHWFREARYIVKRDKYQGDDNYAIVKEKQLVAMPQKEASNE